MSKENNSLVVLTECQDQLLFLAQSISNARKDLFSVSVEDYLHGFECSLMSLHEKLWKCRGEIENSLISLHEELWKSKGESWLKKEA